MYYLKVSCPTAALRSGLRSGARLSFKVYTCYILKVDYNIS